MTLHTWAIKYGLPPHAVRELQTMLGTYTPPLPPDAPEAGKSEAWAQSMVRLEASRVGVKLFRNNVGALKDSTGRVVRFGLANESKQINEVIKSSDLIGWRPVVIQQSHVGHTIAQFLCREMKEPGWQYHPNDPHEGAQLAWINLVNADGGDARFATGVGTL